MKKSTTSILTLLFFLSVCSFSFAQSDEEQIKKVIEEGYVHGAFNELNPEAMKKTFHEDFAIFSPNGEQINKYPIATWVEGVEKRKGSDEFDPEKNNWDHKFASIDISGKAAAVKVELHKDGTHIFTDYLSLLKFDNGWRIVAKVYHKHN